MLHLPRTCKAESRKLRLSPVIVMLSTTLVTLNHCRMGKDTLEKCYNTLRQVAMNCSYCIAILLTKDIPTVLGSPWVWVPPMSTFFLAHAVHARGSDGHQNVLWSISYSHVVREQVKSKKPGVFQSRDKTNPKHKHNPNKHNSGRHPEN